MKLVRQLNNMGSIEKKSNAKTHCRRIKWLKADKREVVKRHFPKPSQI